MITFNKIIFNVISVKNSCNRKNSNVLHIYCNVEYRYEMSVDISFIGLSDFKKPILPLNRYRCYF